PVIEKICRFWMVTNGINEHFSVEWDDITLQDELELAKARLYRAQSERIEQELKSVE
ncbi:MAG TPA: serine/threonine protein phosphatase, partial [Ruminococcaceae bacterium]|nr:serine/threonine protein phosphatase [Oscillospiraceae bacterium]